MPDGNPGTPWRWAPWAEKDHLLSGSAAAGWSPCGAPEKCRHPAIAPWCRPLEEVSYQSRQLDGRTRFWTKKDKRGIRLVTPQDTNIFCDMQMKEEKFNIRASNLLTEFLQVGDHTVAEAILHVVSQQVWCSHDPQSFPQGLQRDHSSSFCEVFLRSSCSDLKTIK